MKESKFAKVVRVVKALVDVSVGVYAAFIALKGPAVNAWAVLKEAWAEVKAAYKGKVAERKGS